MRRKSDNVARSYHYNWHSLGLGVNTDADKIDLPPHGMAASDEPALRAVICNPHACDLAEAACNPGPGQE
jgi:hypothetical protein